MHEPANPTSKSVALHVLPWGLEAIGGVNEVVRNLMLCASSSGRWTCKLLVLDYAAREPINTVQGSVEITRLRVFSPWWFSDGLRRFVALLLLGPLSFFRLVVTLRKLAPSCLNIHYPGRASLTLMLACRIACPRASQIISFHGSDLEQLVAGGGHFQRCLRRLVRRADSVVCCSGDLAKRLVRALGQPSPNIRVVHNGIDTVRTLRAATCGKLPDALVGKRYIVNVATYEPKKGQDVLVKAFSSLAHAMPNVDLVLVGRSHPFKASVDSLCSSLGVDHRVIRLLDLPHEDALRVMAGSELFVLSSRREPFCIVLLEAAVLCKPIVATKVGGVSEFIVEGNTGTLVASEDHVAMSKAIDDMLNDPTRATLLAQGANASVSRTFTWARAFGAYEHLMLQRSPSPLAA
jgi:glycosyltransferase involved in cell wall biosynthesis